MTPIEEELDYPATASFVAAWQALAPGHDARHEAELGYTRSVCAKCEVDWPCPTVAQARQAVVDQGVLA